MINSIAKYLAKNNSDINIYLSDDFKKEVTSPKLDKEIKIKSFLSCIENSNIVLSVGGDGTILSTIRRMGYQSIPILGDPRRGTDYKIYKNF